MSLKNSGFSSGIGNTTKNSAGVMGRFGSTSFTSLRTAKSASAAANGSSAASAGVSSKPKKFFKSRTTPQQEPEGKTQ